MSGGLLKTRTHSTWRKLDNMDKKVKAIINYT